MWSSTEAFSKEVDQTHTRILRLDPKKSQVEDVTGPCDPMVYKHLDILTCLLISSGDLRSSASWYMPILVGLPRLFILG